MGSQNDKNELYILGGNDVDQCTVSFKKTRERKYMRRILVKGHHMKYLFLHGG